MSGVSNENMSALRAATWSDIGSKIRDLAGTNSTDINEWCMNQAREAWARGDEANAIALIIRNGDKI